MRRTRRLSGWTGLTALAVAIVSDAAPAGAANPTYQALRDARPTATIRLTSPLVLERDAFRFELQSGSLGVLSPVAGRTTGAVFVGDGRFRLTPATEGERRYLALRSGREKLEVLDDRFSSLVLLFTDGTGDELKTVGEPTAALDVGATKAWQRFREWERKDFSTNLELRLLQDLLDGVAPAEGVFMAAFEGADLPPAVAVVDPRGAGQTRLWWGDMHEDVALVVAHDRKGGLWYASEPLATARAGETTRRREPVQAISYSIDTAIAKDTDLSGSAVLRLRTTAPVRVIPVALLSTLRISETAVRRGGAGDWTAADFVQETKKEDADAAVVLPELIPAGEEIEVRIVYAGDEVLEDRGGRNFAVEARTSWYPNVGVFASPVAFELTYRVPEGNTVVSVGRRLEESTAGGVTTSRWTTDEPIRVAGFNYGKFDTKTRTDEVSGIALSVYTNPGTPDVIRRINAAMNAQGGDIFDASAGSWGPRLGRVDAKKLADDVLADGVNAVRLGSTYFGPLGGGPIAITQQEQWTFGQSWPSLVFLPYMAFLTSTQRNILGLGGGFSAFVDQVGYHEIAHQWWGHRVGWSSYRDQWLSEGFAEMSAALAVQHTRGWEAYASFWEDVREGLFAKVDASVAPWEAGPITLGLRLSTDKSPWAYQAVVYGKGAFVLHMLRMMMWDAKSAEPDAAFIALMKDFAATYAGKSPSTADFQAVAERHMVPALDATRDGKLDWFFDQWVDGTEIPRITSDLAIEKKGGDVYRVHGTITVSEVSAGFRMLVPLHLELSEGQIVQFGILPFSGSGSRPIDTELKLPKKPKRAMANARLEVLARK